ncbi:aquaporin-like protein [Violaceomyces palustris]|uniref:Aquaporin-like protein n=1 Tax=Violaceomyces palustris TaxID=1673888 RepID=A0ACD0NYV6_9BASI|nr:aquaporin-like protein [Violaceomyces palustris]
MSNVTPIYHRADELSSENSDKGGRTSPPSDHASPVGRQQLHDHHQQQQPHHFQRAHRAPGELELGVTEILEGRADAQRKVAATSGLSEWKGRHVWESNRPEWVSALVAEFFGTLFYCIAGEMATASYVLTTYAGNPQGNLTMIGFAYALGICFSIVVCATTSGGHFNPCITIAQIVFKGFPVRKAPAYIGAQLLGGFVASLIVIAIWHHELVEVTELLRSKGEAAVVFSASGPAGTIALFPTAGRSMGSIFANEFFADMLLSLVIWANLDGSNPFTGPQVAPYTIGLAYGVIVWGFSSANVATNTARDLGSRFACGVLWGQDCFPAKYSALTALTNIPATLVGVSIYTFFLSDTRRPPASTGETIPQ